METFADVLKELVSEKEQSLRKIGKQTGFTSGQLSRWLQGRYISIDNAIKLVKFFNCSLDYLFGLSEERNYAHYITLDYDFENFIVKYKQLLKQKKISHAQFTRQANINESCLRDWKNGHKPLMSMMIILATNLYCSIDYLLGRI